MGRRTKQAAVAAAFGVVLTWTGPAIAAPEGAVETPPSGSANVVFTDGTTLTTARGPSFTPPGRTAIVGDFTGPATPAGDLDDVLWYTAGRGGDALWQADGDRSWTARSIAVDGSYTPLVGAFTDDGKDDIFWYAPGPAPDSLWDFNPDGSITRRQRNVNGTYQPIVGHFTADRADDIMWYAPGRAADTWWDFNTEGGVVPRPLSITGTFIPIVGDFGGEPGVGDGVDDIFWYRPGPAYDRVYDFFGQGLSHHEHTVEVDGDYLPVAGDFTGGTADEIIWYGPGPAGDSMWTFNGPFGDPASRRLQIDGDYRPLAGNLFDQDAHRTDVLWWGPGARSDLIWDFTDGDTPTERPIVLDGDRRPALGLFELADAGVDIIDRRS